MKENNMNILIKNWTDNHILHIRATESQAKYIRVEIWWNKGHCKIGKPVFITGFGELKAKSSDSVIGISN